jgi:hypothetical protein
MPAHVPVKDKILVRNVITKFRNPVFSVILLAFKKCLERISGCALNILRRGIAMKLACVTTVMQPHLLLPGAIAWRSLIHLLSYGFRDAHFDQ